MASASESTSTPTATNPNPNTPADVLKSVHNVNKDLEKSLAQLDLSNNRLPTMGETTDSLPGLPELRQKLTQHMGKQEKKVIFVQDKMFTGMQKKLLSEREKYAELRVKDEIARQVSEAVEKQIKEFLPVSLEEQVRDAREHLERLKMALKNSQARIDNGGIQVGDWQEPLKVVVREDGNSSPLYPANLATLYEYENEEMKDLLEFYEIGVDTSTDWRKRNMNQFTQFIGVRGEVDLK